ncbi:pseudouridine synthase [Paraprevotella clara]|jgi:23S rRNA pseudouridine2605 synthase|uniref:pseudouridine synthase n=1 Tax=Paraprevotella clara TaxID=454154 RepID=UPI00248F65D1|nr:pseudouridine synthase [Paraprevotella clara]BDI73348.1 pseudouridine synthase [Paraprevotella clara]
MEDEKWQDNFAPEGTERSREGYKPFDSENNNRSLNRTGREGRVMRPRIQRAERAYTANGADGAQEGRPFRPSYNREDRGFGGEQRSYGGGQRPYRSYQPRQDYNREGGYANREGGYNREGGFRPNNGGYRREGGYGNREGGYNREGGFRPNNGGYRREGGYGNREGGYRDNNGGGFRRPQGGYGNNRFGGGRPQQRRTGNYDPNAKYSMKKQIEYKELNVDPDAPIRLNKFLANAGVCSRREADEFITAGVVSVNGTVVTELGTKVKRTDEVKFHEQPVSIERKVYVLLNKPKDYVTTSDDPQNRKTVMDLVKNVCRERIYPVGRLDRNTTGVLLFTNDGELASKLTHPKFLKKKIYHVTTDKNVTAADMRQIAEGITLEDGEIRADAIDYASPTDKKQIGIEIHSGKNRIVRRIFEALGYRVVKLDRVLFAGLTKKNVRRGDWRFLTEQEVNMLRMGAFE